MDQAGRGGKGLSARLLRFLVKRFGRVFIDQQMSEDAIRMMDRLISSGAVNAAIADLEEGTLTIYNPDSPEHQARPMYDQPIEGIKRGVLRSDQRMRFVWTLAEGMVRRGILSPLQTYMKGET